MDDQERRLLTLELRTEHDRERHAWELAALNQRVSRLEGTRPDPLSWVTGLGPWLKIILAIALPLAVLAVTGDLKAALKTAKLGLMMWPTGCCWSGPSWPA